MLGAKVGVGLRCREERVSRGGGEGARGGSKGGNVGLDMLTSLFAPNSSLCPRYLKE